MELITTLADAVFFYYTWFDDFYEELNGSEDSFSAFCHSQLSGGIGMNIRNDLGFWSKDTAIYEHMVNVQGLIEPDEMSDLIIRTIHREHNKHSGLIQDELK